MITLSSNAANNVVRNSAKLLLCQFLCASSGLNYTELNSLCFQVLHEKKMGNVLIVDLQSEKAGAVCPTIQCLLIHGARSINNNKLIRFNSNLL